MKIASIPGRFLRRMNQEHPEWWVMLAAAAAWVYMAIPRHPQAGHHHGPAHPPDTGVPAMAMMVLAMMLPLTVDSVRQVARGCPGRRIRPIGTFLAGYLAVWLPAMLLIGAAWRHTASLAGGPGAAAGAVGAAALWEVGRARRPQVRRCNDDVPRASRGWRAGAGCARFGVLVGSRCVGSCWALMAVCVAFAHSLPLMAALFCVQLHSRYRQPASPPLAALAVLGACLASLAMRMAGSYAV